MIMVFKYGGVKWEIPPAACHAPTTRSCKPKLYEEWAMGIISGGVATSGRELFSKFKSC